MLPSPRNTALSTAGFSAASCSGGMSAQRAATWPPSASESWISSPANGRVELEVAEVVLYAALDRERGQELGVEVPRGEPEERTAVALDDDADVGAAGLTDGARDAGAAVIVGGDRERPAAEHLVVLLQMERARRASRAADRGARRRRPPIDM